MRLVAIAEAIAHRARKLPGVTSVSTGHRHEYGGPSQIKFEIGPNGYVVEIIHRPRCECGRVKAAAWVARALLKSRDMPLTGYRIDLTHEDKWWAAK